MPKYLTAVGPDELEPADEPRPPRHRRRDGGRAFMPDLDGGHAHTADSLAENLAEAFLESATSGEERGEDLMNEFVPEDIGGPFIEEEAPDDED